MIPIYGTLRTPANDYLLPEMFSKDLQTAVKYIFLSKFAEILCKGPPEGVNVKEIPSNIADGLSYLQLYQFSCLPGYETNDTMSVFCQPDGMLSLSTGPNCTGEEFRNLLHTHTCVYIKEACLVFCYILFVSMQGF